MKKMVLTTACFLIAILGYSVIPTYYHKLINPKNFRRIKQESSQPEKKIALTFDDGPDPRYTGKLLDVLRENHIPATFFVVAKKADEHPEYIERMLKEGHQVAFHSYEHANGLLKGFQYTKNDFRKCREIAQKHHWDITLFRPPWGHTNLFSKYFAKKNGFSFAYWTVMAEDWSKHATPVTIAKKLMKRVKPGSVICLHDAGGADGAPENTISALKQVLPWFLQEGYTFVILEG